VSTAALSRGPGQPDPCGAQQLLGAEPADRRGDRGPALCRARGGVVRPAVGRAAAAVAGSRPAANQLPAHHRLAGAQAGGVRAVPLSAGAVSVERVPHRL
jgi:hypothetical protein